MEGLEEVKGLLKEGTPMSWLQETLEEELWEEEQFQPGHTPPPPGLQPVWDQLSPLLQGQQRPFERAMSFARHEGPAKRFRLR